MLNAAISVRELAPHDLPALVGYWLNASPDFLLGMGVDLAKMPSGEVWTASLNEQLSLPLEEKTSYCMIWELDGRAVGHSNVNKIERGEAAFMHLHLWERDIRQKGLGAALVRLTVPHFFEKFHLKRLFCEPYALNPAPNRTLEKVGFRFVKTHVTTPGWLNFEQPVNLWELTLEQCRALA
jgi:RimJ/RimL family protein N-acetyltransferase